MVYRLFCLSRRSNGFGSEIEYIVVKDWCKKNSFDYLKLFGILKGIDARLNQ